MNRYDTAEWKELVSIQNAMVTPIDILTITGFMNHLGEFDIIKSGVTA